jgi:ABC-type dipeptide/oligopeptide/nickel transport system permease subunit
MSKWMISMSLHRSKNAFIGFVLVSIFLFCSLFAPIIVHYDPYEVNLDEKELSPSINHVFGTDSLGRDVFARVVYGSRISLKVGILAMVIATVVGTILGGLAGFFGGWIDALIMRVTDIFLAMPAALLALAVMAVFENPSINKIFLVLGFIGWTTIARLVRSRVMEIKNEEYVCAAVALGFRWTRTLFRHILPNSLAPIIVATTLGIAGNILTEAWLVKPLASVLIIPLMPG